MSVASVMRISPPTSVQASPVAIPISFCSSATEGAVPGHAQELGDLLGRDRLEGVGALDDDLARHLAADRVDLAFEVADAGFARVALDDGLQGLVGEQ
jgi:hypothetical protein